tara:strand:+ start:12 stop:143 length:132 start_codon:yes stop_codon:yes gene_type:complete
MKKESNLIFFLLYREINQLYKFRNKIVILSRPNENFEDVLYYD